MCCRVRVSCVVAPQVFVAIVDNVVDNVFINALQVINPGSTRTTGLGVTVAPVSPFRFAVSYQFTTGQPVLQDFGVFGNAVVLGRCVCVACVCVWCMCVRCMYVCASGVCASGVRLVHVCVVYVCASGVCASGVCVPCSTLWSPCC